VKLRPEEEWSRAIVSRALGVPVLQHDDGSRPRMHDLTVSYPTGAAAAVEITAAAEPESIELWKLMTDNQGGRWHVEGLRGGWLVAVIPSARQKRLQAELPLLLSALEAANLRDLRPAVDQRLPWSRVANDLGVASARQSPGTQFPGSVYMTIHEPIDRRAGYVSPGSEAIATWVGEFLGSVKQADVLDKLKRSGAEERHAFVLVPGFSVAPFAVAELLIRDDPPVPGAPPLLPEEVTHVWVAGTWSAGRAFYWSPALGWSTPTKVVEGSSAGTSA
jgi:hypothetical protein